MKIESIKYLNGANVYRREPVTVLCLDLEHLRGKESRAVSRFNKHLLRLLPRLCEHYCDYGQMGGFVEHLHDGTHFNHVVEHIAIELLALGGLAPRHKKICTRDEADDSRAVIETIAVETTRYVLPLAADLVQSIVEEKSFNLEEKILKVKELAADDTELGLNNRAAFSTTARGGISRTREN